MATIADNGSDKPSRTSGSSAAEDHKIARNSAADVWIPAVLTLLAFITRFYHLARPSAVVFDEFHFGKFVNWILKSEYYFDIHPPLGKLLLALGGALAGYTPVEGFMYDNIGKPFGATVFYPLRETAAVFGVAVVPLAYHTARELNMSPTAALLVASALLFDTLLLIESRLILMDSQVLFFSVASLYAALKLWKTPRKARKDRIFWLTLTALIAGCALSIKHTCLATPALIAVISFFGLHFIREPLYTDEIAFAGTLAILTYMLFFCIHFKLLPYSGFGSPYMDISFQKTLLNDPQYDPSAPKIPFIKRFIDLNVRMLRANAGITGRHHWESTWYQWIVNWRGVLYYSRQDDETKKTALVYLLGNPIVVWGALVVVVLFTLFLLLITRYRDKLWHSMFTDSTKCKVRNGIFLLCGWLVNLLPFILVDRSAFLYHYIPGLFYAQLLWGLSVDMLPSVLRKPVAAVCIAAMFGAFLYFAPWVYAIPLTQEQHAARRWLPRWD